MKVTFTTSIIILLFISFSNAQNLPIAADYNLLTNAIALANSQDVINVDSGLITMTNSTAFVISQ